jgi:uncharacterized membrane protein YecN with MAPEG domain
MQMMYHHYFHNPMIFTIIFASLCAFIQIFLTIQVIRLRWRFKIDVGPIKKEIYERRNGALANFNSFTPIFLILFALAENNHANCGLLFFLGGLFITARLYHAYSLYAYEKKTKSYRVRAFGMLSTFAVILALALINLYIALAFSR